MKQICFSLEEIWFIISNAFAISGLIMASLSGIRNSEQTVVDQAYNSVPIFKFKEVNGVKKAVDIPKENVVSVLKEKYRQSIGFFFTAVGIAIPLIFDTSRPEGKKFIIAFALSAILYFGGEGIAYIITRVRANVIVNKLKQGILKTSKGIAFRIIDDENNESE